MTYYMEPNSLYAVTDSYAEEVELTLEEILDLIATYAESQEIDA